MKKEQNHEISVNNDEEGKDYEISINSDEGGIETSKQLRVEDEDSDFPLSFGQVFKKISGIGIPMALSFSFSFEVFLSVFLLNYLSTSEEETAAATLVSILMNTSAVFFLSPLLAVAIYLSGKLGEWKSDQEDSPEASINLLDEDKKEIISSTNANSLMIAGVVTIPCLLSLYFSKDILASVFQQNVEIARIAQQFLRPYSLAIPALATRLSFEQILFSFGKARQAMSISLTSLAVGGLVSGLLGFGLTVGRLKIPKLGSLGIALGFTIESYLSASAYALYIAFSKETREFGFFRKILPRIKNNFNQLKDIIKLGGSMSFTVAIELAMTLAVGVFSGLVGVKEQSAMAYNMQFIYFEFIALAALSFSCAQEISRTLGAKKYSNANRISKYGLLTTLIYLIPLPLVFAISPKALEKVSGDVNPEVADVLKTLVPIMSSGVILDIVRYNLLQQSRAYRDLAVPNIIAVSGMTTGIILAGTLGLKTSLGINGIAIGFTTGIGLTAGGLALRWRSQLKKTEGLAGNPNLFNKEFNKNTSKIKSAEKDEEGQETENSTLLSKKFTNYSPPN